MMFLVKLSTGLLPGVQTWLYQCFFKKYCKFPGFDGKEC